MLELTVDVIKAMLEYTPAHLLEDISLSHCLRDYMVQDGVSAATFGLLMSEDGTFLGFIRRIKEGDSHDWVFDIEWYKWGWDSPDIMRQTVYGLDSMKEYAWFYDPTDAFHWPLKPELKTAGKPTWWKEHRIWYAPNNYVEEDRLSREVMLIYNWMSSGLIPRPLAYAMNQGNGKSSGQNLEDYLRSHWREYTFLYQDVIRASVRSYLRMYGIKESELPEETLNTLYGEL